MRASKHRICSVCPLRLRFKVFFPQRLSVFLFFCLGLHAPLDSPLYVPTPQTRPECCSKSLPIPLFCVAPSREDFFVECNVMGPRERPPSPSPLFPLRSLPARQTSPWGHSQGPTGKESRGEGLGLGLPNPPPPPPFSSPPAHRGGGHLYPLP